MKAKFFWISFGTFAITIALVVLIYDMYFTKERLRLVDQQLSALATGLLASDVQIAELDQMDDLVAKVLEEDPRVILVNIFDSKGKIVYRNPESKGILGNNIPPATSGTFSFESNDHSVRILNIPLVNINMHKILQIGLLMDFNELRWKSLNERIFALIIGISIIVGVAAFMLSSIFIKPLQDINIYIKHLSEAVKGSASLDEMHIPKGLNRFTYKIQSERDEFRELLNSVYLFRDAVDFRLKISQGTSAQMAHELKTPLTIIRNSFELLLIDKNNKLEKDAVNLIKEAIEETDHLSRIITAYLDWSKMTIIKSPKEEIFAVSVHSLVKEISERLAVVHKKKVTVEGKEDLTIFTNKDEITQVIRNIVDNALKFSDQDNSVKAIIGEDSLIVENHGEGFSKIVTNRLGEPFNIDKEKKNNSRGTGIGLALVTAVCKKNLWTLSINQNDKITSVSITFNREV